MGHLSWSWPLPQEKPMAGFVANDPLVSRSGCYQAAQKSRARPASSINPSSVNESTALRRRLSTSSRLPAARAHRPNTRRLAAAHRCKPNASDNRSISPADCWASATRCCANCSSAPRRLKCIVSYSNGRSTKRRLPRQQRRRKPELLTGCRSFNSDAQSSAKLSQKRSHLGK